MKLTGTRLRITIALAVAVVATVAATVSAAKTREGIALSIAFDE